MKPRFLFFLYFLPQAPGTAPKRNYRVLKALSAKAPDSTVFTALYKNGFPTLPALEVVRLRTRDYRAFLRRKTADGYLPESSKAGWWKQAFVKAINSYPLNIVIGEGGLGYTKTLIREGEKRIRANGITHLYSSFRPFADHFAAFQLKQKYPHLVWIADFRDLIVDPHTRHIFFPKAHQKLFRQMFSRADILTTVSDGLARHLVEYNQNVITLRNGIDGEISIPEPASTAQFTMVYTGSMLLDKRNPTPLFDALHTLINTGKVEKEDVKIIYAGKDGQSWQSIADEKGMTAVFENKGILETGDALRLQHGACINVLLTASSDQLQGVLTGKMIEYFAAGSPVLGIIAGNHDEEIAGMLEEVKIGKVFTDRLDDVTGIQSFILEEYQHWKRTGTNRKPVDADVLRNKYSTDVTMQPLYDALGIKDGEMYDTARG